MSSSKVFVIGYNGYGEFGFNDHNIPLDDITSIKSIKSITPCPNKEITQIFSGNSYSIYSNNNYQKLWSAGNNSRGSCGLGHYKRKVEHLTPITFFQNNNIKIKQIFVNPAGYGSFFVTLDDKLYASGRNGRRQLGLNTGSDTIDGEDVSKPKFIIELKNIIDIKSSDPYSIAICSDNNPNFMKVITNWSRLYNLPQDIIKMIVSFCKSTKVYATSREAGTGHLPAESEQKYGWNEVAAFSDINIIKIAVGRYHSMFLQENGDLWSCGYSTYGRLGLALKMSWKHYQLGRVVIYIK